MSRGSLRLRYLIYFLYYFITSLSHLSTTAKGLLRLRVISRALVSSELGICSNVLGPSISCSVFEPSPMPQIPQRLSSLRASSPSIRLFCRYRPPPRFGAAARGVSISCTSIKAALPTEQSVVIDGLAELARMGFAREARVRLAMRGLDGQDAAVRVAGWFTWNREDVGVVADVLDQSSGGRGRRGDSSRRYWRIR